MDKHTMSMMEKVSFGDHNMDFATTFQETENRNLALHRVLASLAAEK